VFRVLVLSSPDIRYEQETRKTKAPARRRVNLVSSVPLNIKPPQPKAYHPLEGVLTPFAVANWKKKDVVFGFLK